MAIKQLTNDEVQSSPDTSIEWICMLFDLDNIQMMCYAQMHPGGTGTSKGHRL